MVGRNEWSGKAEPSRLASYPDGLLGFFFLDLRMQYQQRTHLILHTLRCNDHLPNIGSGGDFEEDVPHEFLDDGPEASGA